MHPRDLAAVRIPVGRGESLRASRGSRKPRRSGRSRPHRHPLRRRSRGTPAPASGIVVLVMLERFAPLWVAGILGPPWTAVMPSTPRSSRLADVHLRRFHVFTVHGEFARRCRPDGRVVRRSAHAARLRRPLRAREHLRPAVHTVFRIRSLSCCCLPRCSGAEHEVGAWPSGVTASADLHARTPARGVGRMGLSCDDVVCRNPDVLVSLVPRRRHRRRWPVIHAGIGRGLGVGARAWASIPRSDPESQSAFRTPAL